MAKHGGSDSYDREHHLLGRPQAIRDLFDDLEARLLELAATREVFTKTYVSFLGDHASFATVVVMTSKVNVYVAVPPTQLGGVAAGAGQLRDVSKIGHYGMGDIEIQVRERRDIALAMTLAREAHRIKQSGKQ